MKTHKKSENCELVYTPVSWNIKDAEQLADYNWLMEFPNKSGKIKECVRAVRLGRQQTYTLPLPDTSIAILSEDDTVPSETDALSALLDD